VDAVVLGVYCTQCLLYSVYHVIGVCYTQCMLYSVSTCDHGMEKYRGVTQLCVLRSWQSCGRERQMWDDDGKDMEDMSGNEKSAV